MESFDDLAQQKKWTAGLKGGDMFKNPIQHPAMSFAEGLSQDPAKMVQGYSEPVKQSIEDVWINRRANASR